MRKLTAINDNIATSNATGVARCAPIPGKIRLQIQNEFRGRYRAALSKGNEAGRAVPMSHGLPPLRCPFGVVHEFACSREWTKQLK